VRKQKKAELLIEKFNNAGTTSIDDIAQKLNVTAADAENVSMANNYIAGIGNEPALVGTIFTEKAGKITKPIQGENGVCVVSVTSFKEPEPTKDYSNNMKQIADQRKSRSDFELFNALKEKANIEDNRGKFY
jgi:hypothetical protein